MSAPVLYLTVGESPQANLARAAATMEALARGESVDPYFGVGFASVGALFAVFTPRRWELIASLREGGAMSVAELARRLKRDYKNVHTDVEKLMAWQAIARTEKNLIIAPFAEIIVDVHLPDGKVA